MPTIGYPAFMARSPAPGQRQIATRRARTNAKNRASWGLPPRRGALLMLTAGLLALPQAAQAQPLFRDRSPVQRVPSPGARPWKAATARTLYLVFDGLQVSRGVLPDAANNISTLCAGTVPPYAHRSIGEDRNAVLAAITFRVRSLLAPFAVEVVTTRPALPPYDLMAIGGTPAICGLAAGFGGFSPLDCDDRSQGDIGFVFAASVTNADMLGVIIVHEYAHTLGLVHSVEACDLMSNLLCDPLQKRFWAEPVAIAADHSGRCFPSSSTQSSAALMQERLGASPPSSDASASHADSSAVADGSAMGDGSAVTDGSAVVDGLLDSGARRDHGRSREAGPADLGAAPQRPSGCRLSTTSPSAPWEPLAVLWASLIGLWQRNRARVRRVQHGGVQPRAAPREKALRACIKGVRVRSKGVDSLAGRAKGGAVRAQFGTAFGRAV